MHWNVCGNSFGALLLPALLLGCRADVERGEPAETIVIRDAAPSSKQRGYDSGERVPNRIEVVVSDPRGGGDGGGGGNDGGPSPLASLVGRSVKVQFRRDALGAAAPAPIPPTGQGPGGRLVSINGIVRSASGGWLVLERDKHTYYLPLSSILLIEQSDAPATLPAV